MTITKLEKGNIMAKIYRSATSRYAWRGARSAIRASYRKDNPKQAQQELSEEQLNQGKRNSKIIMNIVYAMFLIPSIVMTTYAFIIGVEFTKILPFLIFIPYMFVLIWWNNFRDVDRSKNKKIQKQSLIEYKKRMELKSKESESDTNYSDDSWKY